jgi:hypothetical protein
MKFVHLRSTNATEARLEFGKEVISRLEGIHNDIALVGVPAVLSLIEALIVSDRNLKRKDLIRRAQAFCRPDMADTVEHLVDEFEGSDPRRHLWFEDEQGYYGELPGPFEDFPN